MYRGASEMFIFLNLSIKDNFYFFFFSTLPEDQGTINISAIISKCCLNSAVFWFILSQIEHKQLS